MSVYRELDPVIEHRTQFVFKSKRKHIATVNTPNIAYPCQHFKIIIPHGSADHVIVPDTVKITFDLEIESRDKTQGKKILRLCSKQIDVINNSCIYDAYKDLYLSVKE